MPTSSREDFVNGLLRPGGENTPVTGRPAFKSSRLTLLILLKTLFRSSHSSRSVPAQLIGMMASRCVMQSTRKTGRGIRGLARYPVASPKGPSSQALVGPHTAFNNEFGCGAGLEVPIDLFVDGHHFACFVAGSYEFPQVVVGHLANFLADAYRSGAVTPGKLHGIPISSPPLTRMRPAGTGAASPF